jgi:hypothetical protein
MSADDTTALIEPLLAIGKGREEGCVLELIDGRLAWRGGGEPSVELIGRIHKCQAALKVLLGNPVIAGEQTAYLAFTEDGEDLDEAFGRAFSSAGIAGSVEYGRQITGRSKPH